MRKILLLLACAAPLFLFAQQPITRFELSKGAESPAYDEIISWWKKLDQQSEKVKLFTMGPSDAGYPLHLAVVSGDKDFSFESIHRKHKRVILINNGIHPGEPDGIDASMLLARDIATGKIQLPDNIVLAIIPVYNIGGCLNRSKEYRIDQDGPTEKGFRGNSQNLDLNRDFIKCDSKEARSFAAIFHLCDPDVFVDNHVSDGADYQHIMTLLTSQHNKLGGAMGEFLNKTFEPALYTQMKEKGYDLVPYVNSFGDTPESGWPEYWDGPRYSSGYATLWHTFAFVPETHILKTYEQRVKATYALEECFIHFTSLNSDKIKALRDNARQAEKTQPAFPIAWALDRTQSTDITFKGFEAGHKPSAVSGLPRLYYDRSKPFEKKVPFYNTYQVKTTITKPIAYIIPQGWWKVIDLLKLNKVVLQELKHDTTIQVEVYHIEDYKSSPRQYEMHHPNSEVKTSTTHEAVHFRKGDYYIPLNQPANRFLMETLEPQAEDSYFAWNFFDAILGQKEGYSHYVFEDKAAQYLEEHPDVKAKLEQRRAADTAFAKSGSAQLDFVFKNSPYYEPDHMRYPVYRVVPHFNTIPGVDNTPLNQQTIDNLTNLGMLWGFLKYHHPAITKSDYNWDAALVRVLPKLLAATTRANASDILEQWVDSLGKPEKCSACQEIKQGEDVKLMPDYGYIFDKDNFSNSLVEKLVYIKNNRSQGKQHYISRAPSGASNLEFDNEYRYPDMIYPDTPYRLLALYRYWTMIQYFFPDKHLIGEDWNKVLAEFIPVFFNAPDTLAYHLACIRLITRVHDTHANYWGGDRVLNNYLGNYYLPVQCKFIEDKLVVTDYYTDTAGIKDQLHIGDIITKVEGLPVEDYIKKFSLLVPASNYGTLLRDMPRKIVQGHSGSVRLEIERNGQTTSLTVERYGPDRLKLGIDFDPYPRDSSYKIIHDNIGFLYPGKYHNSQLPAIKELFKNTKGIIIDMRCYPSDFMPFTFGAYIKPSPGPFVKFTRASLDAPGLFTIATPVSNDGNKDYYKGKIIVIVNAETQSQAEYTTMAFQNASNVTVIGSTTAGADGNICSIYLPGYIFTHMSGLGVLYPDGKETQRAGVRIDVPVKPTIKGIKEGHDELLEKAIELVEKE